MVKKMFVFFVMMVMYGGAQKIVCAENKLMDSVFQKLVQLEKNFHNDICTIPTYDNRLEAIAGKFYDKQIKIVEHARSVSVLTHPDIPEFLCNVLCHKKNNGTFLEQQIYQDMDLADFIIRLLTARPLTNYTSAEEYYLKKSDGKNLYGARDFDKHNLDGKYTSRDERNLAIFLAISSLVYFINNGNRKNCGNNQKLGTYIEEGVYAGLIGACFEQIWQTAYQFILRDKLTIQDDFMKDLWFKLLNIKLESADVVNEAIKSNNTDRYVEVKVKGSMCIFDKYIYKRFMELVIQPFFVDGNKRACDVSKKAYLHIIGLGTGVWGVGSYMQEQCIIDLCLKMIEDGDYKNISDLDFSWLSSGKYKIGDQEFDWKGEDATEFFNEEITFSNGKMIRVRISKRNPADLFADEDKNKLLVAMYAWDPGSFPGNEYWINRLTVSGDPAAACASTIIQMQTKEMNPFFESNIKEQFKAFYLEWCAKNPDIIASVQQRKEKRILENGVSNNQLGLTKNIETQDNRWKITKFFAGFKICKGTVIPVGIAALCAVLYYCFTHGIGTGMI